MAKSKSDGRRETGATPSTARSLAMLGVLGVEMALAITVGYLVGQWLDSKLDTGPWLMAVCLLVGVAAAFLVLVRTARGSQRQRQQERG